MINIEKINYKGWPNCYRIANPQVDLIVTTDVGPRVIRFGFRDDVNELGEFDTMVGKIGGDEWRSYGGHRLWHAPEVRPRSYIPDNGPVHWEQAGDVVRLVQPVESDTAIQKEIEIRLDPEQPLLLVNHYLRNCGPWEVELAAWAVTVLATGGVAILPLPPRGSHGENLLPNTRLVLWAYTDFTDPRWTFGQRYLLLHQDVAATRPQKVGLNAPAGWGAYARQGHLFVKTFPYNSQAIYPDFGCSLESYTDADILELESLGPLTRLAPGATVAHQEKWQLFKDVPVPNDDADVDAHILSRVSK